MRWLDATPSPVLGPDGNAPRPLMGAPPRRSREGAPEPGPQAFVVEKGHASRPLQAHFHGVDQFQLVVHGQGAVGRKAVRAGCVHYADRNTPYGPLTYGDPGFVYVTLRAEPDSGASYMPDASAELAAALASDARTPRSRRNVTSDLRARTGTTGIWTDLIEDVDGLRVAVVELTPDGSAPPLTVGGSGAWVTVVDGAVEDDGPRRACSLTWCDPGDAPALTATGEGARVALLQLPARG